MTGAAGGSRGAPWGWGPAAVRALRAQRAKLAVADRCTATIAANADLDAYLLEKAWADRLPGAVVKTLADSRFWSTTPASCRQRGPRDAPCGLRADPARGRDGAHPADQGRDAPSLRHRGYRPRRAPCGHPRRSFLIFLKASRKLPDPRCRKVSGVFFHRNCRVWS